MRMHGEGENKRTKKKRRKKEKIQMDPRPIHGNGAYGRYGVGVQRCFLFWSCFSLSLCPSSQLPADRQTCACVPTISFGVGAAVTLFFLVTFHLSLLLVTFSRHISVSFFFPARLFPKSHTSIGDRVGSRHDMGIVAFGSSLGEG